MQIPGTKVGGSNTREPFGESYPHVTSGFCPEYFVAAMIVMLVRIGVRPGGINSILIVTASHTIIYINWNSVQCLPKLHTAP